MKLEKAKTEDTMSEKTLQGKPGENGENSAKKGSGRKEIREEENVDTPNNQEKTLGRGIGKATDGAIKFLGDAAKKVGHFTARLSRISSIKLQIQSLSSKRRKTFEKIGEKIWQQRKGDALGEVTEALKEEFGELQRIEDQISLRKNEIEDISSQKK